ncbi:MAG: UDP-glucose 4-epimerase GalE [Alphaproteobacteria bacterium]|jgi:UDP-arabinose 4-epimerase
MTTILVTGGAGYVGSHACKALVAAGYTPVVYDNLVKGHRWAVKWGPLAEGDLLDRARLDEVLREHKPAAVMHFAAYSDVGESVGDPGTYYRNNILGSLTLLEAMRDHGIGHMVFSSTCAVYGEPQSTPVSERQPLNPINPYGVTKLAVERMLGDFGKAHGLCSVALRYFNAAGADPDGKIGEVHEPETHLIPLVLDVALGRRPRISVFGDDYETPDGTCVRDYIHVADLAEAHILALKTVLSQGSLPSVNLATGQGASVMEVIETARRVTGHPIDVDVAPRRPGDPPVLVANAELANTVLGWTASRPTLECQIRDAWRWHSRGPHGE